MSDKQRWPRAAAEAVAAELVAALRPHCHRIEVAGSLRRGKATVGDAEIIYIPKLEKRRDGSDMFAWVDVDLATEELGRMVKQQVLDYRPNVKGNFTWGIQNKLAIHVASQIPVDFFATTEENFFTTLVIRTGGKAQNLELTTSAQRLGRKLHAYGCGVEMPSGETVRCASERDVFEACGVEYKQPEDRL